MTAVIECDDKYELAQLRTDAIEQGYRVVCIGLTLRYWR